MYPSKAFLWWKEAICYSTTNAKTCLSRHDLVLINKTLTFKVSIHVDKGRLDHHTYSAACMRICTKNVNIMLMMVLCCA